MLVDGIRDELGPRARATLETKEKIIRAAEKLFASEGVHNVSLRQIAIDADQKNTNAVQYHFSDRAGLVQALFESYSVRFEPMRRDMLQKAEDAGRIHDIRTLVEILLLPYLSVKDERGRHSYVVIMGEFMLGSGAGDFHYTLDEREGEVKALHRLLDLMRDRVKFLPEHVFRNRVRMAVRSFSSAVVRWDNDVRNGSADMDFRTLITDVLDQMAAAIVTRFSYDGHSIFSGVLPDLE